MGRPAPLVFPNKVVHDLGLELLLEVQIVVRNTEDLADSPGIVDVLHTAAATLGWQRLWVLLGCKPHGHAYHLITSLLQQIGADGGVYSST